MTDDDTPVDAAWLESVGWEWAEPRTRGLWLGGVCALPPAGALGWEFWLRVGADARRVRTPTTRGQVRRLLAALGVEVRHDLPRAQERVGEEPGQ